jgi:serine/threonine protein kinase
MAEVYRAVTQGPGGFQRQFVIKRIRQEKASSKEFVEMFINEARISALLEHPNIVQVYDFGQVDGDYFLAMEYLRGRNLLALGRRLRSHCLEMPSDLSAYVTREVARGLYHAHTLTNQGKPLGIVHRDISPSNIMLLRTGGVKLLDFGIARATMKLRSITPIGGLVKGKLSYLSPEQVRGQGVDCRTDIFSLGIVLWECLTGLRLFYDPNDLETMRNVLHRPIPRPSEVRPGVPAALDAIALRALSRTVEERYPDAACMGAELEEYLRGRRYSPESAVQLLDDLFTNEDSARELPLVDEPSVLLRPSVTRDSSPLSESAPPPAGPAADEDDTQNDYATVSAVHRMAELAGRQRRLRLVQAAAAVLLVVGAMAVTSIYIPGVRPPDSLWAPVVVTPRRVVQASSPEDPAAMPAPVVQPAGPPSQAGIEIEPASAPPAPAAVETPPETPLPLPVATASRRSQRDGPRSRSSAQANRGVGRGKLRPPTPEDPDRARRALGRGLEALRTGEYNQAVHELEISVLASPTSHDAVKALAEAEFELARYSRALPHARRAVALAPEAASTQALLGDAYFKLRRFDEAALAYAAAAALAPDDASIRARHLRAREKAGGVPAAVLVPAP